MEDVCEEEDDDITKSEVEEEDDEQDSDWDIVDAEDDGDYEADGEDSEQDNDWIGDASEEDDDDYQAETWRMRTTTTTKNMMNTKTRICHSRRKDVCIKMMFMRWPQ
jgi:hypothetical protein